MTKTTAGRIFLLEEPVLPWALDSRQYFGNSCVYTDDRSSIWPHQKSTVVEMKIRRTRSCADTTGRRSDDCHQYPPSWASSRSWRWNECLINDSARGFENLILGTLAASEWLFTMKRVHSTQIFAAFDITHRRAYWLNVASTTTNGKWKRDWFFENDVCWFTSTNIAIGSARSLV